MTIPMGCLSLNAYGRRKLPNNPASLEDLTERLEEETVTAAVNEESVDREESIALVENKTIIYCLQKRAIEQNLKRTSSKVKTHLYASDPDNCLIFNYEFTAEVKKHLVLGTVWEVRFTDEDFHIDLNQELYEECLECTRGV
ncbi:unnamed protein product [Porites lobata]|uniref:Uncharacterized protein n=1 Tax=Porites lobata TaxID=104759 RepID=A0ABN8PHT6_9CNID|nr:unnamed protein product [Porites lobata]